jgi:hypothetical protein
MKNILVTGGAGFIGSHLCRTLLEQNSQNKVLCLDNFYSGSKRNVEPLLENRRFKVLEHDVIKPFLIEEPFDEIYNLACPASPVAYQKNPVYTTKISVLGILTCSNLPGKPGLKSCRQAPARSTANRTYILKQKTTGAMSTRSASVPAMTKANAVPNHCFLIISACMVLRSRS